MGGTLADASLDDKVTTSPLDPARALSPMVPVEVPPPKRVDGLSVNVETELGLIVSETV